MNTRTLRGDIDAFTRGTWHWEQRASDDGKHIATLLVTEHRPVPCNDPVIFALREDWMGQQSPEREAAKKLIQASPKMYEALLIIANQSLGPDYTAEQAVHFIKQFAREIMTEVRDSVEAVAAS